MAVAFLAICGLATLLNLVVDPYGMFAAPRIPGFNAIKPAASDRIRYVKPYYADRVKARTVIGGNSRPEMGLDPNSPCLLPAERPVFNAAVPGASLAQQIQFIEHAAATGEVRRVLLGLDLMDFFVDPRASPDYTGAMPAAPDGSPNLRIDREGQRQSGYNWQRVRDWLKGLVSLETLSDSITTLLAQSNSGAADRRRDGFNPADDYWPIIRHEGQSVLFAQKNRELMHWLAQPGIGVYQGPRHWSWNFESLSRFLDRAQARDIEVVLFINPYHVDYLATIYLTGRWAQLEGWKRTLTQIAEEHAVILWDFNSVSARTSESPPRDGDRHKALHWFWEPAHYRREYGESMLAAMLERDCDASGEAPIGAALTSTGIDADLATLRGDLHRHLAASPAAVRRLQGAGGWVQGVEAP
jgi:hypothetical protein